MRLILSRHGNTFEPGEPVVWAGATNDLPLAKKGIQQAENFGEFLKSSNINPAAIYTGPLKRTLNYAHIAIKKIAVSCPIVIKESLKEIDYGPWTGLTNAEITTRFGELALKNWDEKCIWPEQCQWGSTAGKTFEEVKDFCNQLVIHHSTDDNVVVITSNGKLRYFLKIIFEEWEQRIASNDFKVKTGNICQFEYKNNAWKLDFWNRGLDCL